MTRYEEAQLKQRQLQRELTAVDRAQSSTRLKLDKDIEKGNVDCLPYKSTVMNKMVEVTDDVINSIMMKRNTETLKQAKAMLLELTKEIDLSIITCDFLLATLASAPVTVGALGRQLGHRIIRSYQMAIFIKDNKFYYEEMSRMLNNDRVGDFDRIYKRFLAGAQIDEQELKYDVDLIVNLAHVLIKMVCEHNDSYLVKVTIPVTPKKNNSFISLSCSTLEVMTDIVENVVTNSFDRIPMVCPPRPWTKQGNSFVGGFLSEYLFKATPIQIGNSNRRVPNIPEPYIEALNKLQETKWKVNPFMFKTIQKIFNENLELGKVPRATKVDLTDIPAHLDRELAADVIKELRTKRRKEHVENIKTFSKGINLLTALQQCKELGDDTFYFVHSMDYRGRLYCMSTGLNTQGADYIKALIHFEEAKEVGERGLYWLKVRAANTMGYDKVSLDERVTLIDELIDRGYMEAIAKNPIENSYLWTTPYMVEGKLDKISKPLQFLATCYELATAYRLADPTKHMSRLPVGLDGACNGSQHLSVLSHNEKLAYAVNVLPDDESHDVYQEVVDHMWEHMLTAETFNELKTKGHDVEHIKFTVNWLMGTFDKAPRDLTKRCVMTLPYGSTYRGRMDFVRDFLNSYADKDEQVAKLKNKMVSIITFMIDKSLRALAGDALKAMEFIQKVAAASVKEKNTWIYTTPLGLEVDNFIPVIKQRQIKFINYRIRVAERTIKGNISKIKACSAPNYIHSLDACHLIMTILAAGLESFMAIHDDIGVHPSDTDKLFKVIREQFVELYDGKDYFDELSDSIKLDRPERFDIQKVLESEYFFA